MNRRPSREKHVAMPLLFEMPRPARLEIGNKLNTWSLLPLTDELLDAFEAGGVLLFWLMESRFSGFGGPDEGVADMERAVGFLPLVPGGLGLAIGWIGMVLYPDDHKRGGAGTSRRVDSTLQRTNGAFHASYLAWLGAGPRFGQGLTNELLLHCR